MKQWTMTKFGTSIIPVRKSQAAAFIIVSLFVVIAAGWGVMRTERCGKILLLCRRLRRAHNGVVGVRGATAKALWKGDTKKKVWTAPASKVKSGVAPFFVWPYPHLCQKSPKKHLTDTWFVSLPIFNSWRFAWATWTRPKYLNPACSFLFSLSVHTVNVSGLFQRRYSMCITLSFSTPRRFLSPSSQDPPSAFLPGSTLPHCLCIHQGRQKKEPKLYSLNGVNGTLKQHNGGCFLPVNFMETASVTRTLHNS